MRIKIGLIIGIIIFLIIAVDLIVMVVQSERSKSICEFECDNLGALTYIWKAGGGFSVDWDFCTCIFSDHIKSFKIGDLTR